MSKKIILGLDIGTNSIGWSLVKNDFINKQGKILGIGSRIIPMNQKKLGDFGQGTSVSQTAERTEARGARRIRERNLLRRERLHRVLNILDFLPEHFQNKIDFKERLGQFKNDAEPKLVYDDKNEFIFMDSFNEMLEDFKQNQPQLLEGGKLVPYDWTLYYLRKKALSEKIAKEELAWIILNFNQKRGYYQLRGEEEEEISNKLIEFHSLKIVNVETDDQPNPKGELWYSLHLENGWIYRRSSKVPLFDWKGKVRDFIVTTDLNDDGSVQLTREGEEKRSFRSPKEEDWTLVKKKTEYEIEQSEKTVGTYIYETLLKKPNQKIRGKLVRTIERKFYKKELEAILKKQIELQPELFTEERLYECVEELYRNNVERQKLLKNKDFVYLFLNDIIFYQRPLRSQKSNIGRCSLEFRKWRVIKVDEKGNRVKKANGQLEFERDEEGNIVYKKEYLQAIPKSHPLFQEFRIWQWISHLKIYVNEDNQDVTKEFLKSDREIQSLFDFLMEQRNIKQLVLIEFLLKLNNQDLKGRALKEEVSKYRWNYVQDKEYPCNETRSLIFSRLSKLEDFDDSFLNKEKEYHLWHILYSVSDKIEFEKALKTYARKYNLNEEQFFEVFRSFPPFKSDYGAFSEKAIKNLLPLMRIGDYWSLDNIDKDTRNRIEKVINGEYDEKIKEKVYKEVQKRQLYNVEAYKGLPLWLVQYIVYNRHSEAEILGKWNNIKDLEQFLKEFKQHSLRNPIVEQVVTETLRVVRDIWIKYGKGATDYFDEIHVELGREMKSTADERKRMSDRIKENENTNLRIKSFLEELLNDSSVENVRPYSPMQQEILKIYEEGALLAAKDIPEDIMKISKSASPSKVEFEKYKLWLEQNYQSPYTGQIISLNKLFTPAYEIEHIIPQSRFFDDSFSNKVICESAVNKLKDRKLGFEFIQSNGGEIVELGNNKTVKILSIEEYKSLVSHNFRNNYHKRIKLLLDEVPEKMIERQMNDTRYISKYVSNLLSNIVRAENNDTGVNSKNLITANGRITSKLKQDWGLNDVWNELILPRFIRMNELTGTEDFTALNRNGKLIPTVPLELSKGFQKKRIDHRHHALDALVIACTTRDHVNLLNNQSAKSDNSRYDLQHKLRNVESYLDNNGIERKKFGLYYKPWSTFTQDAKEALEENIVSFKQNLRVINKSTNYYEKYIERDGKMVKAKVKQTKGDNWAIRKPLHKETVSGAIRLRKIKTVSLNVALDNYKDIVNKSLRKQIQSLVELKYDKKLLQKFFRDRKNEWEGKSISRVEIYYWDNDNVASRVSLDTTFNEKKIINSITDSGIQKILLAHLEQYKGKTDDKGKSIKPEDLAFTPEGIEEMNKNIIALNNGKFHQPIYKLRVYESKGNKFAVGYSRNKDKKYVEAAKGTNLFFAIYQDKEGKRSYETIPLNIVIERQKQGMVSVPEVNAKGDSLLMYLSPNDLVYVLEEGESFDKTNLNKDRIYKFTDGSGTTANFVPANIASLIFDKTKNEQEKLNISYKIQNEFGIGSPQSKNQRSTEGVMIKENCIELNIDRLGNVL